MAKEKKITRGNVAPNCAECGGVRFGAGYKHEAGCSKAFNAGKKSGRKGKRGRPPGSKNRTEAAPASTGKAMDLRVLRGMPAEELLNLKHKIDAMLKAKLPELKEKMGMWEKLILSITGK